MTLITPPKKERATSWWVPNPNGSSSWCGKCPRMLFPRGKENCTNLTSDTFLILKIFQISLVVWFGSKCYGRGRCSLFSSLFSCTHHPFGCCFWMFVEIECCRLFDRSFSDPFLSRAVYAVRRTLLSGRLSLVRFTAHFSKLDGEQSTKQSSGFRAHPAI